MPEEASHPINAVTVAGQLAKQLQAQGQEYALGGAIALGYWSTPRGTVDVDVTLYVPLEQPSETVWLLQEIGCELSPAEAVESLREHGFCRAKFAGMDVNVLSRWSRSTKPLARGANTLSLAASRS